MICYSCVHFDESSNRCMWLDISLIGGTVGHCDAFVDIEEVYEEAYEIIRKMFRECCDCIYYDLREGICGNSRMFWMKGIDDGFSYIMEVDDVS